MCNKSIAPTRIASLASFVVATAWILASSGGVAGAQPDSTAQNGDAPDFKGAAACTGCHTAPSPLYKASKVTDFISLTESTTWYDKDKHSRAYHWLVDDDNALGKQMCEILGIDLKQPEGNLDKARQCLSCHSGWTGARLPSTYQSGVTCESCHGPSSKWFGPHAESNWRKMPTAAKEALGMIDVRNPVRRAEQCFSCHIGNVPEGKVVTHEMYAAGHPPLPSIELETFADRMPRHWRYLHERSADFAFRKEFLQENYPHHAATLASASVEELKAIPFRSQAVILGSVIALRESIELFADQAASDTTWPELSAFDCYACHHDLRVPSWRQAPNYGLFAGTPGRPRMHQWPLALRQLGLVHVSQDVNQYREQSAELRKQLADIHKILDERPFGQREKIPDACGGLVKSLDELADQLVSRQYNQNSVRLSLRFLLRVALTETLDYESARQIGWAANILYHDLSTKPSTDQQIETVLAQLTRELRLDARSAQQPIADSLPAALSSIASYDPESFRNFFRKLDDLWRQGTAGPQD